MMQEAFRVHCSAHDYLSENPCKAYGSITIWDTWPYFSAYRLKLFVRRDSYTLIGELFFLN